MLAGRTVLIVETEIIISLSMQAPLHGLGATDIIVLTSPDEFRRGRHIWDAITLAILEIESDRPDQRELVRSALDAGIAVLGLTADGRLRDGAPGFPGLPILVKPVPDDSLMDAVIALLRRPGN